MLINLFSGGRKHHVKSTLKFMRITQQIYTVYMFVHFEDYYFFFRDINTHKIYNLTPDFKSKLFKCNNHILIKSSANKRSLNQLIGPAWNQTRFGRDEHNFLYPIFWHRFTLWMVPVFYLPRCKNVASTNQTRVDFWDLLYFGILSTKTTSNHVLAKKCYPQIKIGHNIFTTSK